MIFICEICKMRRCPPPCPNFEPENPPLQCVQCGDVIAEGKGYYRSHGFPYCESCLDFADAETLVRICEIPKRQWLEQMGFTYETAGESSTRGERS